MRTINKLQVSQHSSAKAGGSIIQLLLRDCNALHICLGRRQTLAATATHT